MFASGMGAVAASVLINVMAGDEVVYHPIIYGNTHSLMTRWLPRFGVKSVGVDFTNEDALFDAMNEQTRVVYFETPVNPLISLVDIAAVRKVVDKAEEKLGERGRIKIVVDNTFATSYCQRALEHGADIIVLSLTKALGGFGVDLGGAVVVPNNMRGALVMYREETGAILSPKSAWNVLTFGLPTLAVRMKAMQQSALEVARFLEDHSKVRKVNYPGLASYPQYSIARKQMFDFKGEFAPGSMIYFELDTDDERRVERFTTHAGDNAYCVSLAVSLGHASTLMENPYNMTHLMMSEEEKDAIGLKRSGFRLSVGLEDPADIIADLNQCLAKI